MKTKILSILILAFFTLGTLQAQTPLTKEEKTKMVNYLNETSDYMTKTLKGLSTEQLNYKPNTESWSVEECLRHLTISETNIWAMFVDGTLASTPDASRRGEVKMTDEQVMDGIESRAQKVTTYAQFEPQNKTEDYKAVLMEFKSLRSTHVKWIKKTDEDLRNRYAETPIGMMDTYQAILFIAGHTKRHTNQMKEVMASPNFPAK